jgi:hypothetical protein
MNNVRPFNKQIIIDLNLITNLTFKFWINIKKILKKLPQIFCLNLFDFYYIINNTLSTTLKN